MVLPVEICPQHIWQSSVSAARSQAVLSAGCLCQHARRQLQHQGAGRHLVHDADLREQLGGVLHARQGLRLSR